jgi:hypothetical protein
MTVQTIATLDPDSAKAQPTSPSSPSPSAPGIRQILANLPEIDEYDADVKECAFGVQMRPLPDGCHEEYTIEKYLNKTRPRRPNTPLFNFQYLSLPMLSIEGKQYEMLSSKVDRAAPSSASICQS